MTHRLSYSGNYMWGGCDFETTMAGYGKRAWRKQKRILSKMRKMKEQRNAEGASTASKAQRRKNAERLQEIADDLPVSRENQDDSGITETDENLTDDSAREYRRDINQRWR